MHIVGRLLIVIAFCSAAPELAHSGAPSGLGKLKAKVGQAKEPADIKNLRMYYEKIDENLAKGETKSARSYLRSAKRIVDDPSAETAAHPDFARLKKLFPKYEKKIDGRESELEEGSSQDELMADAHSQLGYGKGYLERDRYDQAVESLQKCLDMVNQVLKKNPEWKTKQLPSHTGSDMTGGQVKAECAKALQATNEKIEQAARQRVADIHKELTRVANQYWDSSKGWLVIARKERKKKDPYAAIDAYDAYRATLDQIGRITEPTKKALEELPKVGSAELTVGKEKTTVKEFNDRAMALQAEATAELEANQKALEKARDKWNRDLLAKLKGDRRRLVRAHGVPSAWDGDDFRAASKRLKALQKAGIWTYSIDNCETEYHFRGSKIARAIPRC